MDGTNSFKTVLQVQTEAATVHVFTPRPDHRQIIGFQLHGLDFFSRQIYSRSCMI